jgi:NTP pyrophosphatase (non-canonical NTP hydrolase)
MSLTFPQLRLVNVARSVEGWKHPLESWSPSDWLIAVGGEVGEALNVVKKLNRVRDGITFGAQTTAEALTADLADELADAVIYCDLLAARFGVEIDNRSFDEFRAATEDRLTEFGIVTLQQAALLAIARMGDIAGVVADIEDRVRPRLFPAFAFGALVRALDGIAWSLDIDLGAAIVAKFNRTSEKHGMPHRLEVA